MERQGETSRSLTTVFSPKKRRGAKAPTLPDNLWSLPSRFQGWQEHCGRRSALPAQRGCRQGHEQKFFPCPSWSHSGTRPGQNWEDKRGQTQLSPPQFLLS